MTLSFYGYTSKRTEQSLIARFGKSEAAVTTNKRLIKDCTRGIVLLKLTTDRHEASRGLHAAAELLVYNAPVHTTQAVNLPAVIPVWHLAALTATKRRRCKSHSKGLGRNFCRTGEWVRVPEVVSLRRWCSVHRRIVPVSDRLLRSSRIQQMHSSRRFTTSFLSANLVHSTIIDKIVGKR